MASKITVLKILEILSPLNLKMDVAIVPGWEIALEDVPDDLAMIPLREILRTFKFMPAPSEYLALIPGYQPDVIADTLNAEWEHLLGLIGSYGYYQTPELVGRMKDFIGSRGGWKELCKKNFEELKWLKKDYVDWYKTEGVPVYISSQIEQTSKALPDAEEDSAKKVSPEIAKKKYAEIKAKIAERIAEEKVLKQAQIAKEREAYANLG